MVAVGARDGSILVEWSSREDAADKLERRQGDQNLRLEADRISAVSRLVCEGCAEQASLVRREDEFYGTQVKSLCPRCAFQWAECGYSQWSEIIGTHDPLDQIIADANDDIDPNDDTDEGRREPTRNRPRPTIGGAAFG